MVGVDCKILNVVLASLAVSILVAACGVDAGKLSRLIGIQKKPKYENPPPTNVERSPEIDKLENFAYSTHESVKTVLANIAKLLNEQHTKSEKLTKKLGKDASTVKLARQVEADLKVLYDDIVRENEFVKPFMHFAEKLDPNSLSDEEILLYNYIEAALDNRYTANREKVLKLKTSTHMDNELDMFAYDKRKQIQLEPKCALASSSVQKEMMAFYNADNLYVYTELKTLDEQLLATPAKLMDKLYTTVVRFKPHLLGSKKYSEFSLRKFLFEKCVQFAKQRKYLVLDQDLVDVPESNIQFDRPSKIAHVQFDSRDILMSKKDVVRVPQYKYT